MVGDLDFSPPMPGAGSAVADTVMAGEAARLLLAAVTRSAGAPLARAGVGALFRVIVGVTDRC